MADINELEIALDAGYRDGQADAAAEISALKEKLNEARKIIRDTPVLKIDIKVARMRAELEAIEYTKKLVEWDTRARTFLESADG
jgi:hypothetical protein